MEIAIIGLGKMGRSLALQALEKGIKVLGHTKGKLSEDLISKGLIHFNDIEVLIRNMDTPRKILLYIPAGSDIDEYVLRFSTTLSPGDIVMDGGNSYWGDSKRRAESLKTKGIYFLDVGTSGGIDGARNGACFMVGGDKEAYCLVDPVLRKLAAPEACAHVGPSGTGHLVKLIHNGIEFGMLQAIGEGMALLDRYAASIDLDFKEVFQAYRHGSVIRSWLIDLISQQYEEQGGFSGIEPYVEDTGEVNWLINDALRLEVPIPVITQSAIELFRSRDRSNIDYRAIAMMRHGFGGHPFGKAESLINERQSSRVDEKFNLSQ